MGLTIRMRTRGGLKTMSRSMQSPQDLFTYELSAMYSSEQMVAQMLQELTGQVTSPQLKQGLEKHLGETQQHVQNLEHAFQQLGTQPQQVDVQAVRGLQQDFETFRQQQPSEEVLELFILSAAAKTEHYEMACYHGLIEKAQMMGQTEVAQFLQQNLQQEERQAQQVEQLAQQLGQQAIGSTS